MANADELIAHAEKMADALAKEDPPYGVVNTIHDLAAALREARKDSKRLDWLEHGWIDGWDCPYRDADGDWMVHSDDDTIGPAKTIRDAIDAAMGGEG